MFFAVFLYLGLFIGALYVMYLVIKIAVKHAISESLNEKYYILQGLIENAIKQSKIESDENKNAE